VIFKFTFYCICARNSVTITSKHKTLTLEEKIKVIEEHEKKNKRPAKELTVLFKVGKTQIYDFKKKTKLKLKTSG